jgi:glycosyltransferase involved in cell wall biosynthesis
VARRLLGTRAALFGTFLLASSGLLVYYSQFARYWTLVFMLSATYPYAIYLGIRHRNGRGLLVAARDPGALSQAMRQLMSLSVEKRRVMGLNGREYVAAHYSLQAMADRWMALYQELLSKRVPAV